MIRGMFTLALVVTPSGSIHPTLSDGVAPARDIAQILPGESLFLRSFGREDVAREAVVVVSRTLERLALAGVLTARRGEPIVALADTEAATAAGWVQ